MGTKTLGILVLWLALATACTTQIAPLANIQTDESELHLFLQALPRSASHISFSLQVIAVISEDGSTLAIEPAITERISDNPTGQQRHLASVSMPPGRYRGLVLRVDNASSPGEAGLASLLAPVEDVIVSQDFAVSRRSATTLFLSLLAEEPATLGNQFTPSFALDKSRHQLTNLLGFVTDSSRNTVMVFNKRSMETVDVIATGNSPKDMALDQTRGWVYVALARDDEILGIETGTNGVFARARLNFGDEPVEIALSPDGKMLVTANQGSNTVSIIETDSMREVERVHLPSQPTSVIIEGKRSLAYVLQAVASSMSVIDLSRGQLVLTRSLEESPELAALSKDGHSLYVVAGHSPNLTVLDATNLAVKERIFVGQGAASVKVDTRNGLVYVGKTNGEIVVIDPLSLMYIESFSIDGNAIYMAIDNDENTLFALSPADKAIYKIDLVSKKTLATLEVDEGSYAVVLMRER